MTILEKRKKGLESMFELKNLRNNEEIIHNVSRRN